MKIQGVMTFQEIEGGFWGIVADDGTRYVPVEPIPESYRHDGMAVQADIRPAHVLGTAMWGSYIHIDTLEVPE